MHQTGLMKEMPENEYEFIKQGAKTFMDLDLNKEYRERVENEIEYEAPNSHALIDECEQEIYSLINLCRVSPIFCANFIFETIRNRNDVNL